MSENQMLPDVFRGYRKEYLAEMGSGRCQLKEVWLVSLLLLFEHSHLKLM